MTEQIATCPFCGSDNVSPSYCTNVDAVVSGRFVECEDCAACGPVHPPEADAITAWNTRAAPALPVLEGWKLVPCEPTEAMIEAGIDPLFRFANDVTASRDALAEIYRAMLSSSPPDEGSSRSQPIVASNGQTEGGA